MQYNVEEKIHVVCKTNDAPPSPPTYPSLPDGIHLSPSNIVSISPPQHKAPSPSQVQYYVGPEIHVVCKTEDHVKLTHEYKVCCLSANVRVCSIRVSTVC
jgi:hypothetical protein